MDNKNNVGDDISAGKGRWSFSGKVSKTFDEHVDRSVPFYKEGHQLIVDMQEFFLQEESVCYEIGCSTGTLTKLLSENNANKKTNVKNVAYNALFVMRYTAPIASAAATDNTA